MSADKKKVVIFVEPEIMIPLQLVEMPGFSRDVDKLLTAEEMESMRQELATLRQLGTVIVGTGGLRKFRWGAKQKGKRSGVRIVYSYGGDDMPIFLIAIYGKNEKTDMTPAEKKASIRLVKALETEYKKKRPQASFRVVEGRRK